MNVIDWLIPENDLIIKFTLNHCYHNGFDYIKTKQTLKNRNYYIPEDQWKAFNQLLDIQVSLDTGPRTEERK